MKCYPNFTALTRKMPTLRCYNARCDVITFLSMLIFLPHLMAKDIPAPSPACSAHNGASICIHSPQYYLNCHLPGPGTIRLIPASIRRGVSYSDTQIQGSTDRVMGSVCTEDICWSQPQPRLGDNKNLISFPRVRLML